MVGPFVQGMFLIGIIYWYSKGMMSMINDYYRGEFQRKLQTETGPKPKAEAPINVDNFMDYVRELDSPEEAKRYPRTGPLNPPIHTAYTHTLLRFLEITGALPAFDICLNTSSIR
ncbi:uncharacterized protein Dana_GF17349 [Drosophila ananassae]|uniref:Uncharacterized protein n=1 Tax=Drosophila ananassae TaxID=7217 RepID=B3LXT6_DROAN|nr:uncharacterized protein LOC6500134 [Drosophila ananassae]EDV41743.1 uncharacterized protein Dana_GF17349 [Drosophila ananassae]